MKNVNLIALSGKLQSGKDSVADLIQKLTSKPFDTYNEFGDPNGSEWRTDWKIKRFAGKLKEMVSLLTGINVSDLEKEEIKNKELSEEWRIFPVHYVDTYESRVYIFSSNEDRENWVNGLSDSLCARFEKDYILTPRKILQLLGTEAGRDLIHPNIWINSTFASVDENDKTIITDCRFQNEATAIKKRGGVIVRIERPSLRSTSNHPSETSLDNYTNFDYKIINDGTLNDLKLKVKEMLFHFNIIK